VWLDALPRAQHCALILFRISALYKSFTYLLTSSSIKSEKYFVVTSVKELLKSINNHTSVDFIKDTDFKPPTALFVISAMY